MRRREYHASRELGLELFRDVEVLHLAGVDPDGQPVFKTLNGVVDDGWVCFHGSPAGEKTSLVGRPVVVSVEEPVCRLPSWFTDPERACPATALYRGAQAHGVLQAIDEPVRKARVLQRLMEKLQPEGRYVPLDAESPLYRAQVKGLLIAGVPLDALTVKAKLAQNRTPAERSLILERLWERGAPGDVRALELIRAANPDTPPPRFLSPDVPTGATSQASAIHLGERRAATLHAWLPPERATEAAGLLVDEYWNDVFTRDELERAHVGATAWVGATDETGALVASARAIADGGKYAWVYDVVVRRDWRGRGLGKAVMRLMLEHPAVRGARVVRLATKDAQTLYTRFGFVPVSELPPRPYQSTEMLLRRAPREVPSRAP